jgi:hypothetical protein
VGARNVRIESVPSAGSCLVINQLLCKLLETGGEYPCTRVISRQCRYLQDVVEVVSVDYRDFTWTDWIGEEAGKEQLPMAWRGESMWTPHRSEACIHT